MMKKIIVSISLLLVSFLVSSCGESYTCNMCEQSTTKAYYDIDGKYLCESCAEDYWIPLDYNNYKVK